VVKPTLTTRIIQTSQLDQAQILHRVDPVYPELGKRMRVSGTVELRGIIGTDGRIRSLQVLSGHPLLVKAAVDAVSQWIYKPTRLSGQPVEVDAPISVVFRLN
jgi:protein TonB